MPQIRVSLGFAQAADHVIEELAGEVIAGITGNALFPTPPVALSVLQAALTAYIAALVAAGAGGKAETAAKDEARDEVVRILRLLAAYVQERAGGSLADLLTSGFDAVSTNKASVELAKPNITEVLNSGTGRLKLRVGPVANARLYEARHSVGGGPWLDAGIFNSTRNFILTGLTPGTLYSIQVRALGGATGHSEWSDAVSHMSL